MHLAIPKSGTSMDPFTAAVREENCRVACALDEEELVLVVRHVNLHSESMLDPGQISGQSVQSADDRTFTFMHRNFPFFAGPVGALQRGTFSPMDSAGIWGVTRVALVAK